MSENLFPFCNAPYPRGVEPVVAAGMVEREFAVEGGTVHYWITADPDPKRAWIIFLPGLSSDHTLYNMQFDHFAKGWNLFVWDAPAHGRSRPWKQWPSLDEMAKVLLHKIFEENGIVHPVFVGQSFGGYLAQAFIHHYPGSVRAFISIGSSPLQRSYYGRYHLFLLRHMGFIFLLWGIGRSLQKQMTEACSITEHGRRNAASQLALYSKRELRALIRDGFRVLADAIEKDRMYHIDCPLLLVCGTADTAGYVKRYNVAWSNIAGIPITWVEDAGHNANVDNPSFVNGAIDEFLRTLAKDC